MPGFVKGLAFVLIAAAIGTPASAFCEYRGKLYAKTTISEEFRDSDFVVRAKVVDQTNGATDDEDWTRYTLSVASVYKGNPAYQLIFFTPRNSGGFYFESGTNSAVGEDYLLFLNPSDFHKGTVFVNYACGQSKRWNEVRDDEKAALRNLAR